MKSKTKSSPLNVLFVAEREADADSILKELKKAGYHPTWNCVATPDELEEHIHPQIDLILADLTGNQILSNDLLNILPGLEMDIPLMVVLNGEEESALDWLENGAIDYHLKDRLSRLGPSVKKALAEKKIREEYKLTLEALRSSKERYQGVAENAVAGISIADVDERITYANPALAEMLGYQVDQLLEMSLDQIIHPQHFPRILEESANRKKGLTSQYESKMIRSDGETLAVIISASPLTSESGEYIGSHAVITNITDRVRMENELLKSEEKQRMMIEKSPLGFSMTDLEGHVLDASPALCLMLGYSKSELISEHFEKFTHPDDIEENRILYQKITKGDIEYFDLEKRFIHKNGKVIHVLVRSQIVRNFEGDPIFEYALVEDITERKLAHEKNLILQSMLKTISAINHLLVEKRDRSSLINKTCQILTENREINHSWIVLFDEKGEYIESAESGLGNAFGPMRAALEDGFNPNCGIQSLNDRRLICVNDPINECGDCPVDKLYSDMIGLTIPLRYGERNYGLLSVSIPKTTLELEKEKDLIREVGSDIGLALHTIETEQKSAEREAQLKLQSLALESAANAIVITDSDGNIQWVNPAFGDLTGYDFEFIVGKNPRILKSGSHEKHYYQKLWSTISSGKVWKGEVINKKKNGELYTEEMTIAPLLNENDEISNYIAIKQDVSERSKVEGEIRQRTEDLILINKINDAANRGMALEKILEMLTIETRKVFNCIGATVYLYNQDRKILEMQRLVQNNDLYQKVEKLTGIKIPEIRLPVVEDSLTNEFLTAGQPCLINDPEVIQQWVQEFISTEGLSDKVRNATRKVIPQIYKLLNINSLITVPMLSAGEMIGLMDFSRKEPFTEEDTRRVAGIVGQVTLAITKLQSESEKQRSRKLLEALSQAAPEVQQASTSGEIFSVIGEHVAKMGYDVTVFTLNETRTDLIVTYHNLSTLAQKIEKITGLSDLNYSFPLKPGGFFDRIITSGETIFSKFDIDPISETLPSIVKPIVGKIMDLFGWHQSIIAPLAVGNEVSGLLSISGEDLRELDKPAVTTFANQAAIAIERTRLYNETQELAQFNLGIVQNMVEGIVLESAEGFFSFVNPAGEKLLGYSSEELTGIHWKQIVPPEFHSVIRAANSRRKAGVSDQYETDLLRKDGQRITVLVSSSPVYGRDQEFNGSLVVFTDITDRKKAEAEIKQNIKRLDALRIIDQAIIGSFELDVSMNIILEQILIQLEVDAASVLSYQADLQTLAYTNGHGFQTAALQYTNLRIGEGYAGRVAQQRGHVFIPDLNLDDGKIHNSPQFAVENFLAYYGVPLIAKGKLVGVLELFNRSAINPTNEWVNYLKILAGQIAIAMDNSTLFNELQSTNVDLTLAYDATIEGWARALELKDMETEGHSRRVVDMTMALARKMGVNGEKLAYVRRGALLHDIGKMGIPDSILQKPGKLDDEEWRIMKQHPEYAYDWLSRIQYLKPALEIPYAHHERWDGTGYPRGLEGEQIPLEARIFAIVDVWDALNSDRPYRKAWPREKILNHIKDQSGKHFDPLVVEVFMDNLNQDFDNKERGDLPNLIKTNQVED